LILAVLGSFVAVAPPAIASPGNTPAVVRPDVQSVPLASATPAGTAREVSRQRPFSMVAVRWRDQRPGLIEVQTRRPYGGWSPWTELEPMDSAPEHQSVPDATEPLWVGESRGVRVRSDADAAALDVILIDPGRSESDGGLVSTQAVGKPPVIGRAAWGADESLPPADCPDADYMTTVKAATIHHTAGTNDYVQADSPAIVRGIYAYHVLTNGWCDIGYNALVDKYGQIFEGAAGGLDRAVRGAHAGGFNTYTFGVSMMGEYTSVSPTAAQLESVSRIVAWKLAGSYRNPQGQVTLVSTGTGTAKYPAGTAVTLPVIFGHRDVGATECPGNTGYTKLPAIRDRVAALVGDWTASPIYQKWQALGGETGPVGAPHQLEQATADGGLVTGFAGGWPDAEILWSSATGAHEVHGPIAQRWAELGRERSYLGYPTTDGFAISIGQRQNFQHGFIELNVSTGAVVDHRYWISLRIPRTVL
jgi:uncharacterized protein with LGFP repeats